MRKDRFVNCLVYLTVSCAAGSLIVSCHVKKKDTHISSSNPVTTADTFWRGPGKDKIPVSSDSGKLIAYGQELIANTSHYLGPNGSVAKMTNGMNCQNCHLEAGTRPFGNNFGKVYATYPVFRPRSNSIQNIYDRVNDCLERSLNGQRLDSSSREMKAIYAYMKWLGNGIPKGVVKTGTGISKIAYLDRTANLVSGQKIYSLRCQSCHGEQGQGIQTPDGAGYTYPPLWGQHSYTDGAGLYRLSNFAGFIKSNMPFGADYHHTILTEEEAWDLAAYVNSQPRPHKDQKMDWKDITQKPIDLPFGPYADSFPAAQHKYGPFKPIAAFKKNHSNTKS